MQGRYVVKKTIPILVAIALAISVSFGLAARADAASSEQIVFSGIGLEQIVFSGIGFSPSANAPVGLWICASRRSRATPTQVSAMGRCTSTRLHHEACG
jgi:hypothetical protein